MINNPYWGKKISILLSFSAAILLLLTSPVILSNFLQPVQAQNNFSFRTTPPVDGTVECTSTSAMLTFDAQGTPSSSNPQRVDITGGTFQINDKGDRQILYSGNIHSGIFNNGSGGGGTLILNAAVNHIPNGTSTCASTGNTLTIDTFCSTSNGNTIDIGFLGKSPNNFGIFHGAVDCTSQGGGGITTQQSSSSSTGTTTTTTQDRDRDGIPDSADRCTHTSNPRCFKEGTT